ncbi:MAG: hypothetical protein JW741_28245 [Sedimentisphaerales bacterium]|nr:hypothetical protein [Sedimentisphaerales bacterium]
MLTILIAIIASLLVASVRPVIGLIVYVVLSMWYPYAVGTVSVGTIDFSVGRIVILVLLTKVLFGTKLTQEFKVIWLDRLVVLLFAAELVAGVTNVELGKLLENRSGDFFDMALPYFAVRLILKSKQDYLTLLKAVGWSAALLAFFGVFESLTGNNLLKFGRPLPIPDTRLTYFHRAQTTFRQTIYYGAFSAMIGALCAGLTKHVGGYKGLYKFLVIMMFLGTFCTMSSGSLLALIGSLSFMAFYKYRHYWKQALVVIAIMCVIVEIVSNRHFYDVIDRFAFNAGTSWYRGRLFEVAILEGGMSGHWITGYGFEDPGWGALIDGNRTDIVNQYILQLCKYGLVGCIPFCAIIIVAIKRLFSGFWKIPDDGDRWLIWCIGASLFGVLLMFNSVALFGTPMIMLYIVFALCANSAQIVSAKQLHAPRRRVHKGAYLSRDLAPSGAGSKGTPVV